MGPPEEVDEEEPAREEMSGEVGVDDIGWLLLGGKVSQERVRRHDCRIIENEVGWSGSWVEV